MDGRQGLAGGSEALGGILRQQAPQGRGQGGFNVEAGRPAPGQGHRIEQGSGFFAGEQHQGHHAQAIQVHPGLGRGTGHQLRRAVARGHAGRSSPSARPTGRPTRSSNDTAANNTAAHQAEIEQHRQAIPLAPQQVGGGEVAMDQVLAVQHRQHRQQLAQQQHHLAGPKDQLPLGAGREQLGVGAALLPFARQPQVSARLDQGPEAGHLGMEHPLESAPDLAQALLLGAWPQLAQHYGRPARQLVTGAPKHPLAAAGQFRFEPIALGDQLAYRHLAHGCLRAGSAREGWRSGCCKPFPASQSAS